MRLMTRLSIMLLALIAPSAWAKTYVVAVEDVDYPPHHEFVNGSLTGFTR